MAACGSIAEGQELVKVFAHGLTGALGRPSGGHTMSKLETVSTAGVAPRKRVEFWNAAVSGSIREAVADPVDPVTFGGVLRRFDLGAVRFAQISGGASEVTCPRSSQGNFLLQLVLSGAIECQYDRTRRFVTEGDFWLHDVSARSRLLLRKPASILTLRIPRQTMLQYMACPEAVSSVVISSQSATGGFVSRFLREFWSSCDNEQFSDSAPRFVHITLQMITSAFTDLPEARVDGTCLTARHRVRIQNYIEAHITEPDLTPRSIATALGMTPGYLHRLFSGGSEGESLARYILSRRLDECYRALSDRMQAGRSVTAIAMAYGFNSLQHFSKVFRERYGMTPRDVQQASSS